MLLAANWLYFYLKAVSLIVGLAISSIILMVLKITIDLLE